MTAFDDASTLALALACAAGAWRRRNRWFAVLALFTLAAFAFWLTRGVTLSIPPPFSAVADVASVGLAVFLAADAIGLPRPLAIFLGIGMHSREWEFDRRYLAQAEKCRRALSRAGDPDQRESALRDATRHTAGLRRLVAPDPDWAALVRDLADANEASIALVGRGATAEEAEACYQRFVEVSARHDALQDRYRAEAAELRRRRWRWR